MLDKQVIKRVISIGFGMVCCYGVDVLAANDISGIVNTVSGTYKSIGQLMTATAYLAGFGLVIAAIFKFKQHKDNPQQVPMGTPITMLLVGVALIFLPNIIQPAGTSIFGNNASTGGFSGSGVNNIPGGDGT
ncbi:MAG: type IV secretion protein IcmD [Coxiellaceae bacterium]|jgi:intracellular multiplication protein IcmD|nr:type IV secretion protein IcmD [Coxiellaceae bacterium]